MKSDNIGVCLIIFHFSQEMTSAGVGPHGFDDCTVVSNIHSKRVSFLFQLATHLSVKWNPRRKSKPGPRAYDTRVPANH